MLRSRDLNWENRYELNNYFYLGDTYTHSTETHTRGFSFCERQTRHISVNIKIASWRLTCACWAAFFLSLSRFLAAIDRLFNTVGEVSVDVDPPILDDGVPAFDGAPANSPEPAGFRRGGVSSTQSSSSRWRAAAGRRFDVLPGGLAGDCPAVLTPDGVLWFWIREFRAFGKGEGWVLCRMFCFSWYRWRFSSFSSISGFRFSCLRAFLIAESKYDTWW